MDTSARVGVSRIALAAVLVAIVAVAGVAAYLTLTPSGASTKTSTSSKSSSSATASSSVNSPSVTVAMAPPSPLISPGETQNYSSIQVSTAGSEPNGSLTLKAFSPSGLSLVLNETSVSLSEGVQSIPIQLKASPATSPGNYTVTIETSSGDLATSNQTFTVQVVPMLIVLQDLAFHPANATVARGTPVTWLNLDSTIGCCDPGYHTVSFLSGANATSPVLKRFDSWSFTFGTDGTVDYYCTIHPYMKGQLTVSG